MFGLSNLDSHEGTVSGTETIAMNRNAYKLTIINDAAATDLQYKFNSSETYATLKPSESVSMYSRTKTIYLSGNGAYRIWGLG